MLDNKRLLCVAIASALGAGVAQAAMITVDATGDTVAADSECTLRGAITNANANAATDPDCAAGDVGPDEIRFALATPATITFAANATPITEDLTVTGPGVGALTIDATGYDYGFNAGAPTTITDLTITGADNGIVTLASTSIIVAEISGNDRGLLVVNGAGNTTSVTRSSIINNGPAPYAAGIAVWDGATAIVTNSTISGNEATGDGSAIEADGGTAIVRFSTITNNTDPLAQVAGAGYFGDPTITLENSIVSSPQGGGSNCGFFGGYGGTPTFNLNNPNVVFDPGNPTDASCGAGAINADPNLRALSNQGGSPTQVHALDDPSSATDAADPTDCTTFVTTLDQVGSMRRPFDGDNDMTPVCDLGSFEAQSSPVPVELLEYQIE